ncbi:MAG TPA: hypothetical protein PKU97_04425 [Kofleriaceae bacterium]|nr:hypothetical protein [Kofleriaceae bacterium]
MGHEKFFRRSVGIALLVSAAALTACGGGDGPDYATAHPRVYLERNRSRLEAALTTEKPAAVRFKALADRWTSGTNIYGFSAWYAALLGQLTGDAKYCTKAVSTVDAYVKSEEALISAGSAPAAARDSYLEIGDLVGDVLLVYDWCYPSTSSDQRKRWLSFSEQAVWNVWHPEEAKWGGRVMKWSGWSIDNPSNNYYYSFLRATMLLGLAAHGESGGKEDWLAFVRDGKILGQLVPTFESDLQGGGSREGTGYGVAMHRLWELYDLWQGSTGEDLSTRSGHAKSSMLTFIHQIVPTLDRVAPTGDHSRDATGELFDYHRNYLIELAYLFRSDPVAKRALYLANNSSVPRMAQPFMYIYDFLYDSDLVAEPLTALNTTHYAPGIGSFYARSDWSKTATWINLLGGPYTESHAHQDQGSLLFFKEEWLAYDANIESTSGLAQEVEAHNLVRFVKGSTTVEQRNGESRVLAVHRGNGWAHAAVDAKPVYADAAVQKVEREVVFLHPDCAIVFDRTSSAAGTSQVWQLNSPFAPATVANTNGMEEAFTGSKHALHLRRVLPAAGATRSTVSLAGGDFTAGHRLQLTAAAGANTFLNVLWTDGAVTNVTPSDAGGRQGVTVTLADGKVATVRFSTTAVSTTLEMTGGVNVTLSNGIDELPALP